MAKKITAKPNKASPEEIAAKNLQRNLNDLIAKQKEYANPTRTFTVGQEVKHLTAFWDKCVIKETHEDIFYLLEISYTDKERNNNIKRITYAWEPWIDLRSADAKISDQTFNERSKNIMNNFSFGNRELEDLLGKHYRFGVNNSPDYQRDLVWTNEDKESLIDSIFKGIEIGKFVFISLDWKENSPCYEILDGKQRLNAIIEFTQDRFPYKGVFFSQLNTEDCRYFSHFLVTVGESRGELTDAQKYEYFLRLNTRGKEQSKEHLAKVKELLNKVKKD